MWLLFEIAYTHIVGRGRQTVVAMAGVAVGVGFSIAMAGLMQGSQQDFVENLVNTMPHVQISDEQRHARRQPAEEVYDVVAISGLRPRDDRRGIINPEALISWLDGWVDGHLAPGLQFTGVMRFSGRDVGVRIIGVDPQREPDVSPLMGHFRHGSFESLTSGGNNVVIGDAMADKLGASAGSTLTAISAEGVPRRFRIAALFHTGTTARDEGEAYMLLKDAQILSGRANAVNDVRIKLRDPNAAGITARRIESETGYKAVAWTEANSALLEALVIRDIIMYTVVGAIMLVAGFGIFNIISTITNEKARDIAIMKSLGFPARDMRRLFLIEGLVIGGAGCILGSLVGLTLVYVLSQVRFEIRTTGQELTHLPVAWSLLHYLIASGFALGSAAIAGYLPARRAAKVNPIDIIRGAS